MDYLIMLIMNSIVDYMCTVCACVPLQKDLFATVDLDDDVRI